MNSFHVCYGLAAVAVVHILNTLGPRQNGCHYADDNFKCIFINGIIYILIHISFKFVPNGPVND